MSRKKTDEIDESRGPNRKKLSHTVGLKIK